MTLTIEALRGVWRAQIDHRTELAETLEELLLRLAPDAPEEYVWHAAEVLGSILGAETVEVSQPSLYEQLGHDEFSALCAGVAEAWKPTEAQQAYFEGERTEDSETFDPDTFPRGA